MCYNRKMEKVFLIAGKEYPDCDSFAHFLAKDNNKVMVTSTDLSTQCTFSQATWNRTSAISARSLILETETKLGQTDIAFVIFDTTQYLNDFSKMSMDEISKAIDSLFVGYIQLTMELLSRFTKINNGNICFLLKKHPSLIEAQKNPKKIDSHPANPLLSAAESSFISFTENTAIKYAQSKIGIQLIDYTNTINEKEDLFPWLIEYLGNAFSKKEATIKNAGRWISPGTKFSTGWSFLKK